jgi:hypothetical protein
VDEEKDTGRIDIHYMMHKEIKYCTRGVQVMKMGEGR